jgi:hypothetical protein
VKPEELLSPEKLPEDLKWLAVQHRLRPDDPVFLLLAWHWDRICAGEDRLKAAAAELKAAVDVRVASLKEAAEVVAGVNEAFGKLRAEIEGAPEGFSKEVERKMGKPLEAVVAKVKAVEESLAGVTKGVQASKRWQLKSALVVGYALGVVSAVILMGRLR